MSANPFESIVVASRPGKPRTRGLTMIADWGLPPGQQGDLLTISAPFIDLAKVAVGIAALLPTEILREKIHAYTGHDILTFPGGQFLEYSVIHDKAEAYFQAAAAAGFRCIEVSDNLLEIELEAKCALIKRAINDHGLRVLGEVGKKEGLGATGDLAEDAARCLEAGAERVFLEAADFFSGEVKETALQAIVDRCGTDPLIFELPGPWIDGVTQADVHRITRWLINRFGPEVNIANVSPENVLKLEALRLGIGVNAGRV
ncbi:MAG: phosphosulfolactate synthase [Opitutaceae bacterium]